MPGLLQTAGAVGTGLAKTGEQAMSLSELISQQKHRAFIENMATQQFGLEKQKAEDVHSDFQQKQRIQAFQEKQLGEQEKVRKAPMDITVHPMFLALPETQRPEVLKYFQSTGVVDERGVGESGRIMSEVEKVEKSESLFKQFMMPSLEAQKKKITDLYEKVQKKPEDEKLQQEYQAEFNKYQMATGEFTKHINKLQEIQIKGAMDIQKTQFGPVGAGGRVVPSKEGPVTIPPTARPAPTLTPEQEAQQIRIKKAEQRPEARKLLTPEEEAQQIRITGAKAGAQAKAKAAEAPKKIGSKKEDLMWKIGDKGFEGLSATDKQAYAALSKEDQFTVKETMNALKGDLNYQSADPEEQTRMRSVMETYIRSTGTVAGKVREAAKKDWVERASKMKENKGFTKKQLEDYYESTKDKR